MPNLLDDICSFVSILNLYLAGSETSMGLSELFPDYVSPTTKDNELAHWELFKIFQIYALFHFALYLWNPEGIWVDI